MTPQIPDLDSLDLARRLVAWEAHDGRIVESLAVSEACEKLRFALSRLIGAAGFCSVLSRALTLATTKVPSLSVVRVNPNGSLNGLDAIGDPRQTVEAGVRLIAELLGLLVLFIGATLVLRLVSDIWPDLVLSESATSSVGEYDAK
ncbi:MAG TPA: hypothetical protein VN519_07305 [Bryobacteraceae bacterium]|nr:hypothetical protein [Bryobacteraceae bacterium]